MFKQSAHHHHTQTEKTVCGVAVDSIFLGCYAVPLAEYFRRFVKVVVPSACRSSSPERMAPGGAFVIHEYMSISGLSAWQFLDCLIRKVKHHDSSKLQELVAHCDSVTSQKI